MFDPKRNTAAPPSSSSSAAAKPLVVVSREEERSAFLEAKDKAPALEVGQVWFLLSTTWFEQWKQYVNIRDKDGDDDDDDRGADEHQVAATEASEPLSAAREIAATTNDKEQQPTAASARPGPVDNSPLIDPLTHGLKQNLLNEVDYVLLSEPEWNLLQQWYGGGPGIPRTVILENDEKTKRVEIYPYTLRIIKSNSVTGLPEPSSETAISISKRKSVEELRQLACDTFNIKDVNGVRLRLFSGSTTEPLDDLALSLEDAFITDGNRILLDQKLSDGTWKKRSSATSSTEGGSDGNGNGNANGDKQPESSESKQNKKKISLGALTGGLLSNSSKMPFKRSDHPKGLCGLNNLGNTCFMNSALQCLSNTVPLTEYFLSDAYKDEINRTNPLGMKGVLAEQYGNLIKEMWSGKSSSVAPTKFKWALGKFAAQFSGYNQQDSQELLAFLLDGLHEDLNRVKTKPFVPVKESDGRPDDIVAQESWANHLLRNRSIIVDLFQGQLKSTLVCPHCSKVSITFDPFMYLSLPLPGESSYTLNIYYVPLPISRRKTTKPVAEPAENGSSGGGGGGDDDDDVNMEDSEAGPAKDETEECEEPEDEILIKERPTKYTFKINRYATVDDVIHNLVTAMKKDGIEIVSTELDVAVMHESRIYSFPKWTTVVKDSLKLEDGRFLMAFRVPDRGQEANAKLARRTFANRIAVPSSSNNKKTASPSMTMASSRLRVSAPFSRNGADDAIIAEQPPNYEFMGIPFVFLLDRGAVTGEQLYQMVWERVRRLTKSSEERKRIDAAIQQASPQASPQAPAAMDTDAAPSSPWSDDVEMEDPNKENGYINGHINGNGSAHGSSSSSSNNNNNNKKKTRRSPFPFVLRATDRYTNPGRRIEFDDTFDWAKKPENEEPIICVDWDPEWHSEFFNTTEARTINMHTTAQQFKKAAAANKDDTITLYDCLRTFTEREQLGSNDTWYCPTCKEHVRAWKQFDLFKLPSILVIHLKRFQYTKYFRNKLNNFVEFPTRGLELHPLSSQYEVRSPPSTPPVNAKNNNGAAPAVKPVVYDLFAVSNHHGGLGGGHYTAYAKNGLTNKWFYFNDSSCSPVNESDVVSSSAYVLFYQRREE